jgi:hypothetical protein
MMDKIFGESHITELLEKLLIVQLASEGVPQNDIRKIVGCDIVRVNQIARYLRKSKKRTKDS